MALRRLLAGVAVGSCLLLGITAPAPAASGNPNAECSQNEFDDWGSGANQSGAYDANCTGAASANGDGDGNATGEPCAGCVGLADNKNPQGQAPNASDGNAGYECDTNSGIAKTNPAHTGCTTTGGNGFSTSGGGGGSSPVVLGTTFVTETPAPAVAPVAAAPAAISAPAPPPASVRAATLARTGSSSLGLSGLAALLLTFGAMLLRVGRAHPVRP